MIKKQLLILVLILPVLAFLAVPGASAACGEAPAGGVDWTGCDKSGEDWSGADLSGMNLTSTDFTGADLSGATIAGATLTGTIFDGADLTGATIFSPIVLTPPPSFVGAIIEGLDFDTGLLFGPNFTDAEGIPTFSNEFFLLFPTCPLADDPIFTPPYCVWQEVTAVTLSGMNATALPSFWPWAVPALLLVVSAGILLTRRARKAVEIPA